MNLAATTVLTALMVVVFGIMCYRTGVQRGKDIVISAMEKLAAKEKTTNE